MAMEDSADMQLIVVGTSHVCSTRTPIPEQKGGGTAYRFQFHIDLLTTVIINQLHRVIVDTNYTSYLGQNLLVLNGRLLVWV
jgi:hypothetical protein